MQVTAHAAIPSQCAVHTIFSSFEYKILHPFNHKAAGSDRGCCVIIIAAVKLNKGSNGVSAVELCTARGLKKRGAECKMADITCPSQPQEKTKICRKSKATEYPLAMYNVSTW